MNRVVFSSAAAFLIAASGCGPANEANLSVGEGPTPTISWEIGDLCRLDVTNGYNNDLKDTDKTIPEENSTKWVLALPEYIDFNETVDPFSECSGVQGSVRYGAQPADVESKKELAADGPFGELEAGFEYQIHLITRKDDEIFDSEISFIR